MEIFLIKDVADIGKAGEIKDVKVGFARNFLLPQGLAVLLSDPQAIEMKTKKNERLVETEQRQKSKKASLANINGKKLTFKVKADKNGKLYGSIGPKEIADKLGIDESLISEHFKKTGEFDLKIASKDEKIQIKIEIKPEK